MSGTCAAHWAPHLFTLHVYGVQKRQMQLGQVSSNTTIANEAAAVALVVVEVVVVRTREGVLIHSASVQL